MSARFFVRILKLALVNSAIVFASSWPAMAGMVSFRVLDASGAPLKDVLVIVQDLRVRDADEVCRTLSDADGRIASRELPNGLYRIISTIPYGLWKTDIREVLVGNTPTEISPKLRPRPTSGYGDVSIVPENRLKVSVKQKDGRPAPKAQILLRDDDATLATRHRCRADEKGVANCLASGEYVVMIVTFGDQLVSRPLNNQDAAQKGVTVVLP